MTEEITPYDRRADHGKRAAFMRLRLAEELVIELLELLKDHAPEEYARVLSEDLSAAIDGVVNYMRQTPPEGV